MRATSRWLTGRGLWPGSVAGQDTIGDAGRRRNRSFLPRLWRHIGRSTPAKISVVIILLLLIMIVFAPWIARYPAEQQHLRERFQTPSSTYWLGTDELGRDVFSRIVWGSRISVIIGLLSVLAGLVSGVILGVIGGYFGGKLDYFVVFLCDLLLAFPGVLLAIMIISMLGSGISNVIVAIGIWSVPIYARLTRSSVVALKSKEFVEGARAVGVGHTRIILRYLLANSLGPLIVFSTLHVATAILTVAALGFLGLGIAPPTPEWGSMVATGREYIRRAPHLIYMPGIAIFLTVMAFNSLGDTLQDALDPQSSGRGGG